jgi:hypothetical protein
MKRTTRVIASLALGTMLVPTAATPQDLSPELKALDESLPGTLVNDPTAIDWPAIGAGFKSRAFAEEGIPGGGAAREFDVTRAGAQPFAIQAFVPLLGDVDKGETVTVGFWGRAIEARTDDGKGVIGIRFQQNVDPWPGFGEAVVKLGTQWEWHEVSGIASTRLTRRDGVVTLQLAGARQTVQIGQTIVVKGAAKIAADPGQGATVVALPEPLKVEKGQLVNRPDQRAWSHTGPAGSAAEREDRTIWLGRATRFTVAEKGANRWDVGTHIPLEQGITEGDRLLIAIAAHVETTSSADGAALVGIRIQNSEPPYAGFADNQFKVGPKWQLIRMRTTAAETIPAGKATIALHFAEMPQTVDIGPIYVLKLDEE